MVYFILEYNKNNFSMLKLVIFNKHFMSSFKVHVFLYTYKTVMLSVPSHQVCH